MQVKQLGNGGAFDSDKTNSSFLIDMNGSYLLFDCGYNVFSRLRELGDEAIKKIDTVFISHMDDDHMGSLKSLIYYRYFILGELTVVTSGDEVVPLLTDYLSDMNFVMENGTKLKRNMCEVLGGIYKTIGTNHGKPCYGLKLVNNSEKNKQVLLISGDTKANMHFYRELRDKREGFSLKAFHDYSHWDNETSQVHACKEDFLLFYKDYLDMITKYHTGGKFNEEWIDV